MKLRWRPSKAFAVLVGLTAVSISHAQQFVISTVAGGPPGQTPVPALKVAIGDPLSVAVDSSSNIYFTNTSSTVFKVDGNGTLTRIAGIGNAGYSGDNGPAAQAALFLGDLFCDNVAGLAVDASGNLYVADLSGRIRKIQTNGTIRTIAGTGTWDTSTDGIAAVAANLGGLSGVAVDAKGNIYFTDSDPDTGQVFIHKILPDGTLHVLAGVYGYLQGSTGLVVDPQGDLYISDSYGMRVYKLTADGVLHPIAGTGTPGSGGDGGPAISAQLNSPLGLALDAAGDLYIADGVAIREITPDGAIHTVTETIAGSSGLSRPRGVALDAAGNLVVADTGHLQIRRVAPGGAVTTLAGNGNFSFGGDGGPANQAQLGFSIPNGAYVWGGALATDPSGNLYIADTLNLRIRKISTDGNVQTVAGRGSGQNADDGDGLPATQATINYPYGLAADGAGNVYIGDGILRKIAGNGIISTLSGPGGSPIRAMWGLTTDDHNNLYDGLERIALDGTTSTISIGVGGLEATNPNLNIYGGWAEATDAFANLYLADVLANVVRKVARDGSVTVVAGNGAHGFSGDGGPATQAELGEPTAIAVDPIGDLYIADCFNQRVRIVTPDGTISTIAGNGTLGYSGDGGVAINAQFGCINGMATDNAGNLYLSDQTYNAVRKIRWQPSGPQP